MSKKNQKRGLLITLKIIESKNEEQLKAIKDSRENIKTISQYRIKTPLLKSI